MTTRDATWKSHAGWSVISRRVGRTLVSTVCPFCSATVEGYLWSICGSGKKCSCGAVLYSAGAIKRPKK